MISFFDLFAGVGGFRLGLERLGWRCAGWCEIDRWCQRTYRANFTGGEWFWPDARTLPVDEMPSFDVLTAGFPCQAFSIAGRRRGFEDARGTLVYEIFRVLEARRPKAFLLENVKGLVCEPMKSREFKLIMRVLTEELGYQVFWKVLNSKDFGVPQNRERVYIVGFRERLFEGFAWPEPKPLERRLADVLEPEVPEKYYLSPRMREYLIRHLERNKLSKASGFGVRLLTPEDGTSAEVPSTYHKGPGGAGRPAVVVPLGSSKPTVRAGGGGSLDRHAWDTVAIPAPVVVSQTNPHHAEEERAVRASNVARSLKAEWSAQQQPLVVEPFPIRFLNRNQRNFGLGLAMTVDASNTTGVMVAGNVYPSSGENGRVLSPWGLCTAIKAVGSSNSPKVLLSYRIRRLTPLECFRLQGFPDGFVERARGAGVSNTQLYRQAGNAVTVPVVEAVGRRMEERMRRLGLA